MAQKTQTAMALAMEACQELADKSNYAKLCLDIMRNYLPVEREQVEESYRDGRHDETNNPNTRAKEYFDENYQTHEA